MALWVLVVFGLVRKLRGIGMLFWASSENANSTPARVKASFLIVMMIKKGAVPVQKGNPRLIGVVIRTCYQRPGKL